MSISNGVYASNWPAMKFDDKRSLPFLMLQAQKPRYFKASGFVNYTLPNFTTVTFSFE